MHPLALLVGLLVFMVSLAVLPHMLPNPHRDAWIAQCQRQSPTWNCPVMYRNR